MSAMAHVAEQRKIWENLGTPEYLTIFSPLSSVNGPLTIEWRFGISFRVLVPPPPPILSPACALPFYTASRLLMPFSVLPMTSGSLRGSRVIEFRLLPSIQPNFFTRPLVVHCPQNSLHTGSRTTRRLMRLSK
jgi:hypothetical protein